MNYDADRIKNEYHQELVSNGYQVCTPDMFNRDELIGKFSLYAINHRINREKIIHIKEFSALTSINPLLKSLEDLSNAKTQIELVTSARRGANKSQLELELIAAGIKADLVNDFCGKAKNLRVDYNASKERLYIRINTPTTRISKTSRFVMMS